MLLVDEDVGDRPLSGHLQQHLLEVCSLVWRDVFIIEDNEEESHMFELTVGSQLIQQIRKASFFDGRKQKRFHF